MNASTGKSFNTEHVAKQHVVSRQFASGFALGLLAKDVEDRGRSRGRDRHGQPAHRACRRRCWARRATRWASRRTTRSPIPIGKSATRKPPRNESAGWSAVNASERKNAHPADRRDPHPRHHRRPDRAGEIPGRHHGPLRGAQSRRDDDPAAGEARGYRGVLPGCQEPAEPRQHRHHGAAQAGRVPPLRNHAPTARACWKCAT